MGDKMKTRQLIRKEKWAPVQLETKDLARYSEILEWCEHTAGPENFVVSHPSNGVKGNQKKLIFRFPRHATMCRLRWS